MARQIIEIDLSTGPKTLQRKNLGAEYDYLVVKELPEGADLEFSDPSAKGVPIPLEKGEVYECFPVPFDHLFFTYARGAGVARILVTDKLRVGPSGGGGAGASAARDLIFLDRIRSFSLTGHFVDELMGSTWATALGGDGEFVTANPTYENRGLAGSVLALPPGLTANDAADAVADYAAPLASILNPAAPAWNGEFYEYVRTRALVETNAPAGDAFARFGFGLGSGPCVILIYGENLEGSSNWIFRIRDNTGANLVQEELVGYDALEAHDIELRWGVDGAGVAYVGAWIDGEEAHRQSGPLASDYYPNNLGSLSQQLRMSVFRRNGNSTDYTFLWTHLTGTLEAGRVYP